MAYALAAAALLRGTVTLRDTKDMVAAKLGPLAMPQRPPYLVVIGGSNALYSIDSPTLSRMIGMPVVNAAMQWSYTYYMLGRAIALAKPGDVFLLPLEYEYFDSVEDWPKIEACYLLMQDRSGVAGVNEFIALLTRCSPSLVFDALFAELLVRVGVPYPGQPINSLQSPEGDILENAAGANRWRRPTATTVELAPGHRFGNRRLEELVRAARQKGVTVLLTYPVRPERAGRFPAVSAERTAAYEAWAKGLGAALISDPESHMFPVSCFFDSPYHLHRGCTADNSTIYARAVSAALKSQPR